MRATVVAINGCFGVMEGKEALNGSLSPGLKAQLSVSSQTWCSVSRQDRQVSGHGKARPREVLRALRQGLMKAVNDVGSLAYSSLYLGIYNGKQHSSPILVELTGDRRRRQAIRVPVLNFEKNLKDRSSPKRDPLVSISPPILFL